MDTDTNIKDISVFTSNYLQEQIDIISQDITNNLQTAFASGTVNANINANLNANKIITVDANGYIVSSTVDASNITYLENLQQPITELFINISNNISNIALNDSSIYDFTFSTDETNPDIVNILNYNSNVYNTISNKIQNIYLDDVKNGTSNKYIVNNQFVGDLSIQGNVNVDGSISATGTLTDINAAVVSSEKLVINNNSSSTAVIVNQGSDGNILEANISYLNIVTVDNTGAVGIITSTPSQKLDVIGNINCTGLTINNNPLSYNDLANKPSTFTPSAHTHTTSDITGLDTALNAKQNLITALTANANTVNIDGNLNISDGYELRENGVKVSLTGTSGGGGTSTITENTNITLPTVIKNTPTSNNISIDPVTINNSSEFYYSFTDTNATYSITFPFETECDILVVGGGGSGGQRHAGGGGAGACIYLQSQTFAAGTYTITIGNGGVKSLASSYPFYGNNGEDTYITNASNQVIYKAKGGGGGGQGAGNDAGLSGGSSGGATAYGSYLTAINPSTDNIPNGVYGNKGGVNSYLSSAEASHAGCGGGGAGSVGGNNISPSISGNGGKGRVINITGVDKVYAAGGGGGCAATATSAGAGGGEFIDGIFYSIGGAGSKGAIAAANGVVNTGSGGGGSGFSGASNGTAGAGGSGIVIIRCKKITTSYFQDNAETPMVTKKTSTNNILMQPRFINNTEEYYYAFTETDAKYSMTFPQDTVCDILVVGGGGSGSFPVWSPITTTPVVGGGGGGGGAVVYIPNQTILGNATYEISVGNGGKNSTYTGVVNTSGKNGDPSEIKLNGKTIIKAAGGEGGTNERGGGAGQNNKSLSSTGHYQGNIYVGQGGQFPVIYLDRYYIKGTSYTANNYIYAGLGGGGGAGEDLPVYVRSDTDASYWIAEPGMRGGDGVRIDIFAENQYWGGGGSGSSGSQPYSGSITGYPKGGLGGGASYNTNPTPNMGGGGRGLNHVFYNMYNAYGGSGIVVVRVKKLLSLSYSSLFINNHSLMLKNYSPYIANDNLNTNITVHTDKEKEKHIYTIGTGTHVINFEKNTVCDILMVGGGGSGGNNIGGGGGSGNIIYSSNVTIPKGTYNITVGSGGKDGGDGEDTSAFGAIIKGGKGSNSASRNGAILNKENVISGSIVENSGEIVFNSSAKKGGISDRLFCYDTTDMIAWYKFDGNFNDSSGNRNHATNVPSINKYPPAALAGTNYDDNTTSKTISGLTYGNGTYLISWSSDYGSWKPPHWFDGINSSSAGGHFAMNLYNNNGDYVSNKYILADYYGEWIKLTLPKAIYLSYIKIYQRTNFTNRSPINYKIYGTNNGVDWYELYEKIGAGYSSLLHTSDTINSANAYNQFALVTNKIGLNPADNTLNFDELEFYGSEYMFNDNNAIINKSVYFNGLQYLTIPARNFGIFEGLTFSTWVYFTENRSYERIFDFSNAGTNNIIVSRQSTNNNLYLEVRNGSNINQYIYNTVIVNNTWMHVCVSLNKNPVQWKVYFNGVLKTQDSILGTVFFPNDVSLANCYIGRSAWADPYLKGYIDDFRIYKRALTADEIKKIYEYREYVFYYDTTNMLLWCKFDGNVNDSSGKYTGTPTGNGTLTYDTQNKVIGTSSLTFNGSSYIQLDNPGGNIAYWSPNTISVSFWIYGYSTTTNYQAIMSTKNWVTSTSTPTGWIIYIEQNTGNLMWWWGAGQTWAQFPIPYSTISPFITNWMHVVYTFSNNKMYVYINGVLIASKTDYSGINFNNSANLRIGAGANETTAAVFLKSGTQLDDVRIYNRVLTPDEIINIYNFGKIGVNINSYVNKYPPAALFTNSATDQTKTATLSGKPYGNGKYYLDWSTKTNYLSYFPSQYFNGVTDDIGGTGNNYEYNITTGYYEGKDYIQKDYKGSWVTLTLPSSIYLSFVKIYQRSVTVNRAPCNYKIYGTNNGKDWFVLMDIINATYTSYIHTSDIINPEVAYNQYAIVVNKIVGADTFGILGFCELEFYGKPYDQPLTTEEFYNDVNDMVVWYKFDGDLTDSSRNGYDAVQGSSTLATLSNTDKITGTHSLVMPTNNTAAYLTASSGTATNIWSPASSFSVAFWCKIQQSTDYQVMISCRNGSTLGWGLVILERSTKIYFETFNGAAIRKVSQFFDLGSSVWKHVAVTVKYNSSTSIDVVIYIDGIVVETFSGNYYSPFASSILTIGKTSESSAYYCKGTSFDDLRIYNRALSADEVSKLYQYKPFILQTTDMLLWCKFENNLTDSSGKYTGTPTGNGTLTYDSSIKKEGSYSITFNGSSYIQLDNPGGNLAYWSPYTISVSFWIYGYSTTTNYQAIMSARNFVTSTPTGWIIYIEQNTGNLMWWWAAGQTWIQFPIQYSTISPFITNWMHVVYTFSNNKMYVYINSVLIASKTDWSGINFNNSASLRIGAGANETTANFYLKSGTKLDDVRIYNRALSQNEIEELYYTYNDYPSTSFYNNTTNMIAWYKFDENFNDSSGNNRDLVNTNCKIDNVNNKVNDGCVVFNGLSYLTYTTSGTTFVPNTMTICLWAYITGNGWSQIISTQSGTNGWFIQISDANELKYFISNTQGSVFKFGETIGAPVYNTWFHIAMTLSTTNGAQCVYINGNLMATVNCTYTSGVATTLRLGAQVGTPNYYMVNGNMVDDVRIYNRILSSYEIGIICGKINAAGGGSVNDRGHNAIIGGKGGEGVIVPIRYDNEIFCKGGDGASITNRSIVPAIYGKGGDGSMSAVYNSGNDGVLILSAPFEESFIEPTIIVNSIKQTPSRIPGTQYYYYAFTSTTGTNTITFPQNTVCDILVVGGGGGGGGKNGGGGGGGAVVYVPSCKLSANTYQVVVGNTSLTESNGNDSTFGTNFIIAKGGGRGGNYDSDTATSGGSSGGMGAVQNNLYNRKPVGTGSSTGGFAGIIYQNTGGVATLVRNGNTSLGASGGGGAGAEAIDNNHMTTSGFGGNGIQIDIDGNNYYWGGGGGGAGYISAVSTISITGGAGGKGGGGGGGYVPVTSSGGSGGTGGKTNGGSGSYLYGGNGGANTGGGGGGGGDWNSNPGYGGLGGSGIVIVRWKNENITNTEPVINVNNIEQIPTTIYTNSITAYNYYAFTNTTLSNSITFPQDTVCDVLVVGGGGSGGVSVGSGGGAGGLIYKTGHTFSTGTYNITIGAGGKVPVSNTDTSDNNGKDTYIKNSTNTDLFRAFGGGGGIGQSIAYYGTVPRSGGSGGGGCRHQNTGANATQIGQYNYGNKGGNGTSLANSYAGGGGGGAGTVGGNATTTRAGDGGNGLLLNIRGVDEYFAGGGGGSAGVVSNIITDRALGGKGGGGNGGIATNDIKGSAGIDGTGGGGGGGEYISNAVTAGNGGSGIVIIRWRIDVQNDQGLLIDSGDLSTKTGNVSVPGGSLITNNLDINDNLVINTLGYTTQQWRFLATDNQLNFQVQNTFYKDTTNMTAWYKFDGDLTDSSGNGYHAVQGSSTLATLSTTDKILGTHSLVMPTNNTAAYLTASSGTATNIWSPASSFSVAFWCKIASYSNYQLMVSCRDGPLTKGWNFVVVANSTNMYFETFRNGGNTTSQVNLGTSWKHITATVNYISSTSTTVILYINGVSTSSFSGNCYSPLPSSTLTIGKASEGNIYFCNNMYFDDFRIYNRALSQDEIINIYYNSRNEIAEFYNDTTNMMAWYKFDGTNGVTDSSGNGKNATATGTPTVSNNLISITKDNYMTLPSNIIDFNNDITISFWYRFNSIVNNARLFELGVNTNINSHDNSINILTIKDNINSPLWFNIDGTFVFQENFYHILSNTAPLIHVTWVIGKSIQQVYRNGVLLNQKTTGILFPKTNTYTHSYLGKSNWNNNEWSADNKISLKDFRIYNRALSADEIKKLYDYRIINFYNDTTDMVAWYKFDGNFTDSSGNGYNITTFANTAFETNNNRSCIKTLSDANITLPSEIHPYNIWNNSASGITFSSWFRADSLSGGFGRLFDFQQNASSVTDICVVINYDWPIAAEKRAVQLFCNGSEYKFGVTTTTKQGTALDGNWHHLVWSINKDGFWNVYYDGTNLNVNITKALRNNTTYNIRYLSDSAYPNDSSLIGNIQDFRIYNRALTPDEIFILYNNTNIAFNWDTKAIIKGDNVNSGYVNFTGVHHCVADSAELYDDKYIGYIVSSTKKYKSMNSHVDSQNIQGNIDKNAWDALPIVTLAVENDKNVFGIISKVEDYSSTTRTQTSGNIVTYFPKNNDDRRLHIAGVGEGGIWVCDYNGAIESGDYICVSPITGIGMKQNDDILHNYTVAKATMDCDFNPQSIPLKTITTMKDENDNYIYEEVVDEQNEVVYEDTYDVKYIRIDGTIVSKEEYETIIDFENTDKIYKMVFIGCSYHCS